MEVKKTLTIQNESGLHIRAARVLVETANRYQSEIWLEKEELRVNGKSIMGILQLSACQGNDIAVTCNGEDAEALCGAIEQLVSDHFGLEDEG